MNSITKCLEEVCLTNKYADIFFSFPKEPGLQRVPAHKMILSLRSSVFEAMFFGELAETSSEVKIEDISGSTFEMFLKYLYTDVTAGMSGDNVIEILYTAKKYQVQVLTEECGKFLENSMNAENACAIYGQSKFFDMESLSLKAMNVIQRETDKVIHSDGFQSLSKDNLMGILKSDSFCVEEIELFKSVMSWSIAACSTKKLETTIQNRRDVLAECLYLLRIPSLPLKIFRDFVVEEGILTDSEELQLFRYITQNGKQETQKENIAGFVVKRRNNIRSATRRGKPETVLTQFPMSHPFNMKNW